MPLLINPFDIAPVVDNPDTFTNSGSVEDINNNVEKPIVDMAKFLLKKDLILTRITKYDDNPSLYLTWKLTFQECRGKLERSTVRGTGHACQISRE
jgi:hypothetical protein